MMCLSKSGVLIDSTSSEGNAFYIMGIVKKVLQQMGESKTEIEKAMRKMESSDYENLCRVANEITDGFVEIV